MKREIASDFREANWVVREHNKGAEALRAEVNHLRRLARGVTDERVLIEIGKMIEELERRAAELEKNPDGED